MQEQLSRSKYLPLGTGYKCVTYMDVGNAEFVWNKILSMHKHPPCPSMGTGYKCVTYMDVGNAEFVWNKILSMHKHPLCPSLGTGYKCIHA